MLVDTPLKVIKYLNLISPLLLRVFGIPRWGWQMELLTGRSNLNEIWHANTDSILNNSFSSSSFFFAF